MEDNIHPVVRLLAKRMESHPEEFGHRGSGRWAAWLDQLIPFVTEAERVMLRGPMMQDIHEEVMDELLNGDGRRAEERRKREEVEKLAYVQQQRAYLQQSQSVYLGSNQYANHIAPANLRLGSETLDEGMIKQIKRKLGL